ncbi:F-box/LRR-repeat protein At3g48880 [Eucalyptus grandis]|uniref:F-box/LRR-repeat protein At3g48880 n=1 Tax=Eucalyptus grandis TaxID=71139 RepID=UPI00192F11D8|nr:F-box/LRR-repeat protein At3g48880 [Eucalyptus grandis]XP_010061197.2 F-box/LRR-repeat protein At3g48880 [Eucalyptus grandis]XP_039156929.1 F-box/LRR-repeat protein At3g48880 [Eucalyptus grandis]
MEESGSATRKWEDLNTDMLVEIFQTFDISELTSRIAHVCSAWHLACRDPLLWKTLDLSALESTFIKIPQPPYVYVHSQSDKAVTQLLKIALNLSQGSIQTLIFHFNLYLSDEQLTYTAESCPLVKRVVMPAWNRIKETGICRAIKKWRHLESMTMPSIKNPPYLLEEISRNCENFSKLKIMGPFDMHFALPLVTYIPRLKVLSLRCSVIMRDALVTILDNLQDLEVLNISHCILIEARPPPLPQRVVMEIDPFIMNKANRLREFLVCMNDSCVMCQRARSDEGLMRWYQYEEGLWKSDEARSLAL